MNLITQNNLTMNSLDISDLLGSRHDSVKRTIETLASKGVIEFPQSVEIKTATKPTVAFVFSGEQDRCPNSGLIEHEDFCRYLTRSEMEQAQNLPIGYTKSISYNQAQAVLGNCWDVGMITHIFEEMKKTFQIQERLFA